MKVLFFTNMYPFPEMPYCGIFVKHQFDALKDIGVEGDVLFVTGRTGRLNYVKSLGQIRQMVAEGGYDLVHSHHHYCSIVTRAAGVKLPMVYTCHAGAVMTKTGARMLANISARLSDFTVPVSEEQVPFLRLRKGHWKVVPCGIDFSRFGPISRQEALETLGLPDGRVYILFPADPARPEKRFDIAQKTVKCLQKWIPNVEILILNNVEYSEVPAYFSVSDAMVFVSDHEGSPMVIKEALIAGLPIVSVDVGDVRRTIEGVEGCYLVEREPRLIAEKLAEAIRRGRPAHDPSRFARFDVRTTARELKGIYELVLDERAEKAHKRKGSTEVHN